MNIIKTIYKYIFLSVISASFAHAACIPSGTEVQINAAIASTGTAVLCQGATFTLSHQITLSSNNSLYTSGFPTNTSLMATLIWAAHTPIPTGETDPPSNPNPVTAYAIIDALGTNIDIQSIIVDGNLTNNTYYGHSPLIRNSGSRSGAGNTINYVTLQHTLGFVALDVADDPNCSSLTITNNYINSNGVHLPEVINGVTVKQAWANGITIRCSNSMVSNNQIRDASDGGIDFLGGTNTMIENNWIANSGQSAFGGILIDPVMAGPGTTGYVDFTGSYVQNNLIQTSGQHLHAAISVGTQYSCELNGSPQVANGNCQTARNPNVINNTGSGTYGWGIYLGGATGATVTGNNLTMTPLSGMSCGWAYYVMNVSYTSPIATPATTGTFQSGYTSQALEWPCIVIPSEGSF